VPNLSLIFSSSHQCKQFSKIKTFEIISVSYVKLKIIYEIHSTYNLNIEVYFFIFALNMILPETILQFTIKDIHQCKRHVCIIVTYDTLMISNVFILLNCLHWCMSFIVNCRIVSGKHIQFEYWSLFLYICVEYDFTWNNSAIHNKRHPSMQTI
jgi:hypothetical protein